MLIQPLSFSYWFASAAPLQRYCFLCFVREEVFNLCAALVSNHPAFHTGSHPLGFRSAHWLLIVSCHIKVARLVILLAEQGYKKQKKNLVWCSVRGCHLLLNLNETMFHLFFFHHLGSLACVCRYERKRQSLGVRAEPNAWRCHSWHIIAEIISTRVLVLFTWSAHKCICSINANTGD